MRSITTAITCLFLFSSLIYTHVDHHQDFAIIAVSNSNISYLGQSQTQFIKNNEAQTEVVNKCQLFDLSPMFCTAITKLMKGAFKSGIVLAKFWILGYIDKSLHEIQEPKTVTSCYRSNNDGLCLEWSIINISSFKGIDMDVAGFDKNCTKHGMITQSIYHSDRVFCLICFKGEE